MVNGVYGYSGQDIYRQQAQRRAAEWAQRSAAQLQAAQGQQAGQVQYAQQPQQGYVQYTQQSQPTQQVQQSKGCTDGKDDGKIGPWEALKSFGKGALKFVGGLVGFDQNGNWSAGRLLKNVVIGGVIAAACVLTAGTAIPAIIAGAGVAMAAGGLAKSQYQFWTAKTDADAKAAMEGTGSNTLALGLSLVGAKAAMKQVPGVDPSKYTGFKGTLRAGWDSTTIGFKQGWNGIRTGLQAYKAGGWSALKTTAIDSAKGFKDTVVTNWKNATKTPTVEETQADRAAKYDKEISKLEAKKGTDNIENAHIDRQINRIKAQKASAETAYRDINEVTSFKDAQAKIGEVEGNIAKLQRQLESATKSTKKYALNKQIAEAQQQLSIYKNVTNVKVSQARNLRAEIEYNKKLLADSNYKGDRAALRTKVSNLEAQETALKFDLPGKSEHASYVEKASASTKDLVAKQKAYDTAKADLEAAQKANSKFPKGDPSDEAMLAQRRVYDAQANVRTAAADLDKARISNNSNNAYISATSGYDIAGTGLSKAGAFVKSFNNMYGELNTPFMGKTVPLLNWTIPGRNLGIGKSWTIPATNELVNSSVGGPSLDEMVMKELQYEQIAQVKSQLMQQGYTEAQATALINEAMNGGGATQTATAQAQYTTPQFGQYTTGQASFGMNAQNLDYTMKAMGIVA